MKEMVVFEILEEPTQFRNRLSVRSIQRQIIPSPSSCFGHMENLETVQRAF